MLNFLKSLFGISTIKESKKLSLPLTKEPKREIFATKVYKIRGGYEECYRDYYVYVSFYRVDGRNTTHVISGGPSNPAIRFDCHLWNDLNCFPADCIKIVHAETEKK